VACVSNEYGNGRKNRQQNLDYFGIEIENICARCALENVIAEIINKPARALDASEKTKQAYSFAKRIEDILCLAEPVPTPADTPKNPIIIGEN